MLLKKHMGIAVAGLVLLSSNAMAEPSIVVAATRGQKE
jgi:hypothetical protein